MNNFPLVGGSVFSISAIFMACVFNVSKHFGVAVNWNFRNNALISYDFCFLKRLDRSGDTMYPQLCFL